MNNKKPYNQDDVIDFFSLKTMTDVFTGAGICLVSVDKYIKNFITKHSDSINKIKQTMVVFTRKINELDENQKKTVKKCFDSGWYPIWNMIFTNIPDDIDFDVVMENIVETHLNDIEEVLCETYKDRNHILKSAFEAHRQGVYVLSIPILLIQAEGICKKYLKISPFSRDKNTDKRILKNKIPDELLYGFIFRYLQPVVLDEKISENSDKAVPDRLNRHAILHGTSTDYGTCRNSLKAISFLSSLSFLLLLVDNNELNISEIDKEHTHEK